MMRVADLNNRGLLINSEDPYFEANKLNLEINVHGIYEFSNEINALNLYITYIEQIL